MKPILPALLASVMLPFTAAAEISWENIDQAAAEVQPQVVEWRRWFHQHPELSNREFKTSARIAEILKEMGLEPETGIAHTGVVAVIEGGKPGPLVAIRADIDGLPVTEQTDLPFASKARTEYNGQETGVMHACGHDAHMAMALGAAKILNDMKADLAGSVMVIFQPAEEGAPEGEQGGAKLMLEQGLFDAEVPEAVFGIHIGLNAPPGEFVTKPGPMMASADRWKLRIIGRQTHGARPWGGIDPIVVSAQVVMAYQTIASRQVDVTKAPSIISVGRIAGGIRNNVIPSEVELEGTIRAFDPEMRAYIHQAMERTAVAIAESAGASAEFEVDPRGTSAVINDDALVEQMWPVVQRVSGEQPMRRLQPQTVAEDFSEYGKVAPSMFVFLGSLPEGVEPATAPSNHSPFFDIHEPDLEKGVRLFGQLVTEYLQRSD
jgi:amidohydrolase